MKVLLLKLFKSCQLSPAPFVQVKGAITEQAAASLHLVSKRYHLRLTGQVNEMWSEYIVQKRESIAIYGDRFLY
jgi:hypothetical protein